MYFIEFSTKTYSCLQGTKLRIIDYTYEKYNQVLRSLGRTKRGYTDPDE